MVSKMKGSLIVICFLASYLALADAFVNQEDIKAHIHDLQAKLCTGKVSVAKLAKGEACHRQLVPKDVKPIEDNCEKKTKCQDIAKIKTGNKKHDTFLCAWCSDKQQQCLISDITAAFLSGKLSLMTLNKDLQALDDDIQCIANTVGAKIASVAQMG